MKSTAALKNKMVDKKSIVRSVISIGGVMFLFGLTWLFAILTFSAPGVREAAQILFTLFNTFQGLFIFLFICVISSDARDEWKRVFNFMKLKTYFSQLTSMKESMHMDNSNSTGMIGATDHEAKFFTNYNTQGMKKYTYTLKSLLRLMTLL